VPILVVFRAFSIKTAPFFRFNSDKLTIDSEMIMEAANASLLIKGSGRRGSLRRGALI
jgi:hypothetical protein